MKEKQILIQTSSFFTEETWLESSKQFDSALWNLSFIQHLNELDERLNNVDAAFLVRLPENLTIPNNLKFLYSGISDFNPDLTSAHPNTQLSSSKGIAADAIAEFCLMSALMLVYRFPDLHKRHLKRKWDQGNLLGTSITPLHNRKIGILGMGNNGSRIAKEFKKVGCSVYGYSRTNKNYSYLDQWYGPNDLDRLLSVSDIVILALPSRPETRKIINSNTISHFKKNAFIINIGRGDLIDEQSLIHLLKSKYIGGAVLDVVSEEPLSKRSALWKFENLIITPHISGNINNHVADIQRDFFTKLSKA